MSSVLSGSSMGLNNVYIRSIGSTCGIDEFNGPLGDYFDRHYPDFHCGYPSYEQAEIAMLEEAINFALKKGKLTILDESNPLFFTILEGIMGFKRKRIVLQKVNSSWRKWEKNKESMFC